MKVLFLLSVFLVFDTLSYATEVKKPSVHFELIDNRIFADVFINSQGPFKFIFDTGGNNSMTFSLAQRLGLTVKEIDTGTGAGAGSQPMGETQVQKMQFADITLTNQDFLVTDYSKIQKAFNFKALDGIFGFEILQKYLTLIDYENLQITFFSNADDFVKTGFEALRFDLIYNKPFIKSYINGIKANTLIDTGDRSALTVTKKFTKNTSVAKVFKLKPTIVSGYGIGGPIPAKISQLKNLKFGNSNVFHNVSARAPTADGGFNAIEGLDASLGNEILKQFTMAYDYKNKTIYLKRNKNFGQATVFTPVPNP